MKLHWISWQPTPYNNFLFESLEQSPGIDLTVHFVAADLPRHPWKNLETTGFEWRVLEPVGGLDRHLVTCARKEPESFFVVAGWSQPVLVTLLTTLILLRRRFAIWTDTPRGNRRTARDLARAAWLKLIFRRAVAVMGTGRPGMRALAALGTPDDKLVDLPFFVDLDRFRPDGEDDGRGRFVLASVGRLENRLKGLDVALSALASLDRDIDLEYRVAGTGPDLARLKDQARALDLEDRVSFLGWMEVDDLPDFYRSCDILLHPARHDPFPVTVLEAMASGVPVIGSDTSGSVLDRVEHMNNGLIHRTDDAQDLAGCIQNALKDRSRLRAMGRAARQTAEAWPVSRGVETIATVMSAR